MSHNYRPQSNYRASPSLLRYTRLPAASSNVSQQDGRATASPSAIFLPLEDPDTCQEEYVPDPSEELTVRYESGLPRAVTRKQHGTNSSITRMGSSLQFGAAPEHPASALLSATAMSATSPRLAASQQRNSPQARLDYAPAEQEGSSANRTLISASQPAAELRGVVPPLSRSRGDKLSDVKSKVALNRPPVTGSVTSQLDMAEAANLYQTPDGSPDPSNSTGNSSLSSAFTSPFSAPSRGTSSSFSSPDSSLDGKSPPLGRPVPLGRPAFSHYDFLSPAAPRSSTYGTSHHEIRSPLADVTRPPLPRSLSEDVANYRPTFASPETDHDSFPSLRKAHSRSSHPHHFHAGTTYPDRPSSAASGIAPPDVSSNLLPYTTDGLRDLTLEEPRSPQMVWGQNLTLFPHLHEPVPSNSFLTTALPTDDRRTNMSISGDWSRQSASMTSTRTSILQTPVDSSLSLRRGDISSGFTTQPLQRTQSVSSHSSSSYSRSLGSEMDFHLATGSNFDPATAAVIRKAAATVRADMGLGFSLPHDSGAASCPTHQSGLPHSSSQTPAVSAQGGLMGTCGNGHFGNVIRQKATEMLDRCLSGCKCALEGDVVSIVEYGSLNSLSSSLVHPMILRLLELRREQSKPLSASPTFTVTFCDGDGSDLRPIMTTQENLTVGGDYQLFPFFATKPFPLQVVPANTVSVGFSLMDLHCRRSSIASRELTAASAAHDELKSFLDTRAIEFRKDGLLLLAFIQRKEDENLLPRSSSYFDTSDGSNRSLDSNSPDVTTRVGHPAQSRTFPYPKELDLSGVGGWSKHRSMSYPSGNSSIVSQGHTSSVVSSSTGFFQTNSDSQAHKGPSHRSRSHTFSFDTLGHPYNSSGPPRDIWSAMPRLLAPCIRRLVATGMIKSDAAQRLLSLPLYPRTPRETQAVLRAVQDKWQEEWSCGLQDLPMDVPGVPSPTTPTPTTPVPEAAGPTRMVVEDLLRGAPPFAKAYNEKVPKREEALSISHPAYTAYRSTTLTDVQFAEHALQFIKIIYEDHFRHVLTKYANITSRTKLETVLDNLSEVLNEKLSEPSKIPLNLEMEICILALRRL